MFLKLNFGGFMKKLALVCIVLLGFGCSSDNDSGENSSAKIENPVKTYVDYNKNMMNKPQEVQEQMDKMMQQRQEQLKKAEEQY